MSDYWTWTAFAFLCIQVYSISYITTTMLIYNEWWIAEDTI